LVREDPSVVLSRREDVRVRPSWHCAQKSDDCDIGRWKRENTRADEPRHGRHVAIQPAKHLDAKVGTTTSTANVELVRSFGPDEVVDYQKQEFEEVLRVLDAVLGTVKSDALKESLRILKPGSTIVSLVGPPDATFARKRRMSFAIKFIFGALSLKITRLSKAEAPLTHS